MCWRITGAPAGVTGPKWAQWAKFGERTIVSVAWAADKPCSRLYCLPNWVVPDLGYCSSGVVY
jgi:hypothetical protein